MKLANMATNIRAALHDHGLRRQYDVDPHNEFTVDGEGRHVQAFSSTP